jgi:septin family protein
MVVGESGLGKSTLINSMFLADIYSPEYPGPSHRIKKTVQVCLAFLFNKLFLFFKEKKKEEKQNNRFYFYFYFD